MSLSIEPNFLFLDFFSLQPPFPDPHIVQRNPMEGNDEEEYVNWYGEPSASLHAVVEALEA